jgi:hypothetical protein
MQLEATMRRGRLRVNAALEDGRRVALYEQRGLAPALSLGVALLEALVRPVPSLPGPARRRQRARAPATRTRKPSTAAASGLTIDLEPGTDYQVLGHERSPSMPILHAHGQPICRAALPKTVADEFRLGALLTCALVEDHTPAPAHAALLDVGGYVLQVSWRDDDSFIPLQNNTGVCCLKPAPAEVRDALGTPFPIACKFEPRHRGACTFFANQLALSWWTRGKEQP